jgi:tetratricopeptide (TPR) repeat protein
MEANYLYDEGVKLILVGDYINACQKLDSALDIRRSIYKSEDNHGIIEVKQAYASAFMSMGDFNKASLLFEELLEVLESLIHNEGYDAVAKHRQKYVNVLISLAEAKVNQLLLNDATDMLLKLKIYLDDIQKEVNHHHNLFNDKEFEIRECRLNAKISVQQGCYDKACSIYHKIIDLANNDLSEYEDYDDDKSSMTIHQLQCASYIVDAYDNLAEISLIFYKIDDFGTLHATSLSVKGKYFEESHPTFGYSKYLEAKQNSVVGCYKQAYEIISELIISENSKYNDKSTILAKYVCLQADLETLFGHFGNQYISYSIHYIHDHLTHINR